MQSRVVEAVQNLIRRNRWPEIDSGIIREIIKTVFTTYETVAVQQHMMERAQWEQHTEYVEHTRKRMLREAIEQALANGYLPTAMPTEELRYTKIMYPGGDFPLDSDWDTVLIKLSLPLRRAYLDKPYILRPKADDK